VVLFFPVYVWQNFAFEKESGCTVRVIWLE